jgi:hypothetical protein
MARSYLVKGVLRLSVDGKKIELYTLDKQAEFHYFGFMKKQAVEKALADDKVESLPILKERKR